MRHFRAYIPCGYGRPVPAIPDFVSGLHEKPVAFPSPVSGPAASRQVRTLPIGGHNADQR